MQEVSQLRKRLAPSTPLRLDLTDDDGSKFGITLKLCFDFNAASAIDQKTGLPLVLSIWDHVDSPKVRSVMLWAAALPHQPEYGCEEACADCKCCNDGLATIRSYMDGSNSSAILDALWRAYVLFLPAEARKEFPASFTELLNKLKEAKRKQTEVVAPGERPLAASSTGSSSGPLPVTTSDSPTESSAA